jgi:LCCL domain-containing protein
MLGLCDTVGATYYFRIRGTFDGVVWGTGIYTGDSFLGTAAVHAGLVKVDQTAVVKVTVVAPLQQYQGSVCHGVTSRDFGRYGTAYRLSTV